jgi:hypothetical protein
MTSKRVSPSISFLLIVSTVLTIAAAPIRIANSSNISDFASFVSSVHNGQAGVLRGVYVPWAFALPVVQQPANNSGYVAPLAEVVTDFRDVKNVGNIGLLAHNFLAGKYFFLLQNGQEVRTVNGDGSVEYFHVTKILSYQALNPQSVSSDFIDLETGERLSAGALFQKVYQGARHLTFQTCIERNGNASWGRLFVIAEPFTPPANKSGNNSPR